MLSGTTKNELRSAGRSARQALTRAVRLSAAEIICTTAANSRSFAQAKLIACYLASDDEVDCRFLIERAWRMKKRIFLPTVQKHSKLKFIEFFNESETRTNLYGLEEPVGDDEIDPHELHLVFAPLVAFDVQGNRIGMGGGYYDRTFAFMKQLRYELRPRLVGLAFECQRVEQIDASTWDIPLFHVITESDHAAQSPFW